MQDEDYTKREMDSFFRSIEEKLDKNHADLKGEIGGLTEQVKRTNGRVKSLELWRSFTLGVVAVLSFAVPFVLYLLGKF